MKLDATTSLLLSGMAGLGSSHIMTVPECATDCSNHLLNTHALDDLKSLCMNTSTQRELFLCLSSTCPVGHYGPALAHSTALCIEHHATIGNLYPVEFHQNGLQYQSPFALNTRLEPRRAGVLAFKNQFTLAVDCTAGSDGVLTLSVPDTASIHTAAPVADDGSFSGSQNPNSVTDSGKDSGTGASNNNDGAGSSTANGDGKPVPKPGNSPSDHSPNGAPTHRSGQGDSPSRSDATGSNPSDPDCNPDENGSGDVPADGQGTGQNEKPSRPSSADPVNDQSTAQPNSEPGHGSPGNSDTNPGTGAGDANTGSEAPDSGSPGSDGNQQPNANSGNPDAANQSQPSSDPGPAIENPATPDAADEDCDEEGDLADQSNAQGQPGSPTIGPFIPPSNDAASTCPGGAVSAECPADSSAPHGSGPPAHAPKPNGQSQDSSNGAGAPLPPNPPASDNCPGVEDDLPCPGPATEGISPGADGNAGQQSPDQRTGEPSSNPPFEYGQSSSAGQPNSPTSDGSGMGPGPNADGGLPDPLAPSCQGDCPGSPGKPNTPKPDESGSGQGSSGPSTGGIPHNPGSPSPGDEDCDDSDQTGSGQGNVGAGTDNQTNAEGDPASPQPDVPAQPVPAPPVQPAPVPQTQPAPAPAPAPPAQPTSESPIQPTLGSAPPVQPNPLPGSPTASLGPPGDPSNQGGMPAQVTGSGQDGNFPNDPAVPGPGEAANDGPVQMTIIAPPKVEITETKVVTVSQTGGPSDGPGLPQPAEYGQGDLNQRAVDDTDAQETFLRSDPPQLTGEDLPVVVSGAADRLLTMLWTCIIVGLCMIEVLALLYV